MSHSLPPIPAWQRLGHRLFALRPLTWLWPLILPHVDLLAIGLSGGRTSVTGLLAGLPIVTLTTLGAKSGLKRSVPLVGIPEEDKLILIASNFGQAHHPAWYLNLRAHPEAEITRAGQTRTYIATEATGAEYARYWERAVQLYLGYAAYRQRAQGRVIPILVFRPQSSSSA